MATVKASKFVNEVIYKVDQNSLKKVRDTNKRLSKEMSKTDPISGTKKGQDPYKRSTRNMNAHVKAKEKHLKSEMKMKERLEVQEDKAATNKRARELRDNSERQNSMDSHMKARQNHLKQEERQQRNLQRFEARKKERTDIFLEDPRFNGITKARAEAYRTQLLQEKSSARLSQRMRTILRQEKERTKELRKQNAIQQRMSSSAIQMAGGFVSAFAAVEGLTKITQTGMQMEGVAKSFLVSSGSAKAAKENMAFVREEAMRLGIPLIEASKGFSRMMAAAGDKMSLEDLKTTFIGVNEAATALGLSSNDVSGTILAIQQMMSKNKVQADEMTQQLGERLPFAMRAMANAATKAGLISETLPAQKREAALFKLMEQGKLISSQVLPYFGRELRKLANEGGGLTDTLENNLSPALGTAMNHLVEIQDAFYLGGWKQETLFLTKNFNDQADALKALSEGLGSLAGEVFSNLVGPLQLALATIMDIKAALDMDVSTEDKASDIGGTLKKALPEMNKYFKKMPLLSPSAFAGDMVNSVAGMFPDSGFKMAAPYVPSATLSSYSPRGSRTPIPVQITVKGTDGLIDVVHETVNDANNSMLEDALGTINGGD